MPELALDDSPAGAEAFVRHYIDVLNHAALTGDTSTLQELSSPDCSGCTSYRQLYERIYDAGGKMTGGEWDVASIERLDVPGQSFVVEITASAGTSKTDAGAEEERHEPYEDKLVFAVGRAQNSWNIESLDRAVEQ